MTTTEIEQEFFRTNKDFKELWNSFMAQGMPYITKKPRPSIVEIMRPYQTEYYRVWNEIEKLLDKQLKTRNMTHETEQVLKNNIQLQKEKLQDLKDTKEKHIQELYYVQGEIFKINEHLNKLTRDFDELRYGKKDLGSSVLGSMPYGNKLQSEDNCNQSSISGNATTRATPLGMNKNE